MKYIKIYFLIQIIFLFTSCSTLKDGFKNQKKGNSDEFLVEKKSPLIMPPDYGELPIPKPENDQNYVPILILILTRKRITIQIYSKRYRNIEYSR